MSRRIASRAKKLRKNFGYGSEPERQRGKKLSNKIIEAVRNFYFSDEVSRCIPGLGDYKSVSENGQRSREQKNLLVDNLRKIS